MSSDFLDAAAAIGDRVVGRRDLARRSLQLGRRLDGPQGGMARRVPRAGAEPVRRHGGHRPVPRRARGGDRRLQRCARPRWARCARPWCARPPIVARDSTSARSASPGRLPAPPRSWTRRSWTTSARDAVRVRGPCPRRIAGRRVRQRRLDARPARAGRAARRRGACRRRGRRRRGVARPRHASPGTAGRGRPPTSPAAATSAALSHGAGGIGWALLELYAATGDDRFRVGAEGAFAYERRGDATGPGRISSGHDRAGARRSPAPIAGSWCHGEAGIALARLRAAEMLGPDPYEAEASAALAITRRELAAAIPYELEDLTLCHGAAGSADVAPVRRRP